MKTPFFLAAVFLAGWVSSAAPVSVTGGFNPTALGFLQTMECPSAREMGRLISLMERPAEFDSLWNPCRQAGWDDAFFDIMSGFEEAPDAAVSSSVPLRVLAGTPRAWNTLVEFEGGCREWVFLQPGENRVEPNACKGALPSMEARAGVGNRPRDKGSAMPAEMAPMVGIAPGLYLGRFGFHAVLDLRPVTHIQEESELVITRAEGWYSHFLLEGRYRATIGGLGFAVVTGIGTSARGEGIWELALPVEWSQFRTGFRPSITLGNRWSLPVISLALTSDLYAAVWRLRPPRSPVPDWQEAP